MSCSRHRNHYSSLFLFFLLSIISACSTISDSSGCTSDKCKSTIVSKSLTAGGIAGGVVYTIPKQLLEFRIERKEVTKKSLEEALEKSAGALVEAKKSVAAQKKTIKDLDFKVSKAVAGSGSAGKLALEAELARVHLLLLTQAEVEKAKALASAKQSLKNFKGETYRDNISLKALDPIPDGSKRFSAQLQKSAFTSETIEIKTTPSGLLSGGMGKSEGNVDEVFVALVKSFATLKAGPSVKSVQPMLALGPKPAKPDDPCNAIAGTKLIVQFDPANERTLDTLNKQLITHKLCYKLHPATTLATAATIGKSHYDGLVYPGKAMIQFDLYRSTVPDIDPVASKPHRSFFPVVIDQSVLGVISLPKGYFADNDYEFEFSNGMLTRYKSVTPNQLLSALSMIPEAGKALLSIPAEIIQLKVNYSTQEKAYVEAQQAIYEARLLYEKSLESEVDAQLDVE